MTLSSEAPGIIGAVEVALRRLPLSSPLRPLIYEQFLDSLARGTAREARIAALTLLGSTDPDAPARVDVLAVHSADPDIHLESVQDSPADKMVLDLLVLTPKGRELEACVAVFGLEDVPTERFGADTDLWRWEADGLSLGLAAIGTDGNVEAAIEINRIAEQVDVRAAVLVGMAAGLEGAVNKGDIVIATDVLAYEFNRVTKGKYHPRSKPYHADPRAVQKVDQVNVEHKNWVATLYAELKNHPQARRFDPEEQERLTARWRPKVRTGVVLAGSRVIEDGSLRDLKSRVHDKALAAEMEGAGFAAACSSLRISWMVIRGIADYGDQDVKSLKGDNAEDRRGKSWQFPSTFVAAAYVRDMILTRRIPLLPQARRLT